ncbi:N-acetyl-gamma-glutamyl-phosphate reductase [Bartonella sp. DGB1]|uniref:N-acetyl-gamma-glutamyl-phosphate reductase n=1 Tax=Bartonella sp. DGB1 TaxID=3239807 RepID=UPI003523971A
MAIKVFIDGEYGTTGLQIHQRLAEQNNIKLISIDFQDRHNITAKKAILDKVDVAILCLPDQAAVETVKLLSDNDHIRIIDASTAHRTNNNWIYGFAEMCRDQKKLIQEAKFISNPGCYATGAIALIRPLTENNIIPANFPFNIHAVSGYTGGGKELIKEMQLDNHLNYFTYNMHGGHKHLPEITKYSLLKNTPIFTPSVGSFPQGMLVCISLNLAMLETNYNVSLIKEIYTSHYANQNFISIATDDEINNISRLNPADFINRDDLKIYIFPQKDQQQILLVAQLDNLGKGAAGAAVQNLELMFNH